METGREPRILVVDDNPIELEQTLEAVRNHGFGYEIRIARGGHEALDYLLGRGRFHERRRHPLPDILMLDLNMPAMDGHTIIRRMKEHEALRKIPVIGLCVSEEERRLAMQGEVRANSYAVKPLSPARFRDLIRQAPNWTLNLDFPLGGEERAVRWPLNLDYAALRGAE